MKRSPLQQLKQASFESKAGLVEAVKKLAEGDMSLERLHQGKGLDCVSNRKLLRLHAILTQVKANFGGRRQLVEAICKAEQRTSDENYQASLRHLPLPRLLDQHRTLQRRQRVAA